MLLTLAALITVIAEQWNNYDHTMVKRTFRVELVNGSVKTVTYKLPIYTDVSTYGSDGGYRFSYWEYGIGGHIRMERTLLNGVVWFDEIK